MKIIFFGSDDFAAAHLAALFASQHEVVGCVTQPDRPKGRGMKVMASPIKSRAESRDIPVLHPDKIKDRKFIEDLAQLNADVFIVIAYGRILPQKILSIPRYGAINVHGSLLPAYRGAAPINWAIIKGERLTGISIIQMNPFMDAGAVLSTLTLPIATEDTAVTLRAKMMQEGPTLLLQTIGQFPQGLKPVSQDTDKVSLAPKLTKELGRIDWTKKAQDIHNLVRGLLPWPAAYTFSNGKMLKVLKSTVVDLALSLGTPGEIVQVTPQGFVVRTSHQGLLIQQVHPESSKPMSAAAFLAGHHVRAGERLGA